MLPGNPKKERTYRGVQYYLHDPENYLKTEKETNDLVKSFGNRGHRVRSFSFYENYIVYISYRTWWCNPNEKYQEKKVSEQERTAQWLQNMPAYLQRRIAKTRVFRSKKGSFTIHVKTVLNG